MEHQVDQFIIRRWDKWTSPQLSDINQDLARTWNVTPECGKLVTLRQGRGRSLLGAGGVKVEVEVKGKEEARGETGLHAVYGLWQNEKKCERTMNEGSERVTR